MDISRERLWSTGGGIYNINHFSKWLVLFHEFSSDWCYKSQFRKNDLLQNSKKFQMKNLRVIGLIAVIPAQIVSEWLVLESHMIPFL